MFYREITTGAHQWRIQQTGPDRYSVSLFEKMGGLWKLLGPSETWCWALVQELLDGQAEEVIQ